MKPGLAQGKWNSSADHALRPSFGKRAVVGAAAVVTKDVPDYAVAVGDPAQIIRYPDTSRFADKMQKAIFKLTTSVSVRSARRRLFLHSFARARPYCA